MSAPVMFLPHGGGPMPLLGDPAHEQLTNFLRQLPNRFEKPESILLISAHWEENYPSLTSGANPALYYDYGGFPEESYHIQYPAPGNPELARRIRDLLQTQGINARLDPHRNFDHGMFVPLKLMYPKADIPCVQLSLRTDLDAGSHLALGEALSALRDENLMIIGSGMSFHNIRAFFIPGLVSQQDNFRFNDWLIETCTAPELLNSERKHRLLHWPQAPSAMVCHPRAEHLLPLHVCFGIANASPPTAELIFNNDVMDKKVCGFLWS